MGGSGGAVFASANITDVGTSFVACASALPGGAIFTTGAASLASSQFSSCSSASDGGAVAASAAGSAGAGSSAPPPAVQLSNCSFAQTVAASSGGAIAVVGGSLRDSSSVYRNTSASASGGAVSLTAGADGSGALGTFSASTFTGCAAVGWGARGGAVAATNASVTFSGCNFTSNWAQRGESAVTCAAAGAANNAAAAFADSGGALFLQSSALTVSSSTFASNTAAFGGSAFITGSAGPSSLVQISGSSFANSTALRVGGALFLSDMSGRTVMLSAVQAAGNRAADDAGFVYMGQSPPALTASGSTFVENSAGNAGGVAFFRGAGAGSPTLPAFLTDGSCVFTANGAGSWGQVYATNVTSLSVTLAATMRSGSPLRATLVARDGLGQSVTALPGSAVEVSCLSALCGTRNNGSYIVGISGMSQVFYSADMSFSGATLSGPEGPYSLRFRLTSSRLPAPVERNLSIVVTNCDTLEALGAGGACECVTGSFRNLQGQCRCGKLSQI